MKRYLNASIKIWVFGSALNESAGLTDHKLGGKEWAAMITKDLSLLVFSLRSAEV